MRQSILFLSILGVACATSDDPDAMRPLGERVIEGSQDYLEDSVGYLRIECGGVPMGYCSSTLIGSETVLTAGHCVYDPGKKVDPNTCRFSFQTPTTANIGVRAVDIHPNWKGAIGRDFPNNDLAVLHLEGMALGAHTEVRCSSPEPSMPGLRRVALRPAAPSSPGMWTTGTMGPPGPPCQARVPHSAST